MPLDIQNLIREVVANTVQGVSPDGGGGKNSNGNGSGGGLSGAKGLAAGAAAALAPLAIKGAGKLTEALGVDSLQDLVKNPGDALDGAVSNLGDRLTSTAKDKAKGALDEAGGPGGMVKEAAKGMLPGGGDDDESDDGGGKGGAKGVGKGRRMPIQQSVDIGLPIETVYNQWTQFEDWPNFMHRVTRASQEDDCTVSFAVKIWGKTKESTAKIETQRPEQRIKWKVTQGMTHTGIVTFHELGPNLTRVLLGFDVDPGSLVEKFARGARHVKRAARADLHRFKAFIEMAEQETGAWRGVIEDGEIVEEHDPNYDEQREYSNVEELTETEDEDESDSEDENEDEEAQGDSDDQDDDEENDEEESSRPGRRQSRTPTRTGGRKKQDSEDGDQTSRSGGRGSQASGSSRSARRSSRSQRSSSSSGSGSGRRSRSTSSGSGGRSRPGGAGSNRQSGARGRGRSQNRQS